MENNNINWDIIFMNTLSQEANLFINKKILAKFGLDLAVFIAFLANQYQYFFSQGQLTDNNMFFATDDDIFLFTNMPRTRITSIKKQAQELGLITIKKIGQPVRTYYKVNFQILVEVLSNKDSIKDLAYNRVLAEAEENLTEEYIRTLSYRELRLLCKKFAISYKNLSTKEDYIKKIIEEKVLKTSKNTIVSPCAEELHTENSTPVCGETAHACAENSPTRVREICTKYKSNQAKSNTAKIKLEEFDFFDNLFNELGICFTKTNRISVERIRKNLSLKDTERYLRETHKAISENKDVKNIAALFSSKIAKGERQINPEKKDTKKIVEKDIQEKQETPTNIALNICIEEINNKVDIKKDNILETFNKLEIKKKLEIEKEALKLLCQEEDIDSTFVLRTKEKSLNMYYGMLKKYIEKILDSYNLKQSS